MCRVKAAKGEVWARQHAWTDVGYTIPSLACSSASVSPALCRLLLARCALPAAMADGALTGEDAPAEQELLTDAW